MKNILSAFVIPLLLGSNAIAENKKAKPAPKAGYSCVAGPDEICASDLWYAEYKKLKALQEKYSAPQDVQDMMSGMNMRLAKQIPAGYGWDEGKQRFVNLQPTPKPPATPVAPEKK